MPFSQEQKRRLMRAYAPVLYLHERERFVPINPAAYLERSALWDDQLPGSHRRDAWGHIAEEDIERPPRNFPRSPLLRPGQLTTDPTKVGGGVHYLGEENEGRFPFSESNVDRALFLDSSGWNEGDNIPPKAGEPGLVGETTKNRLAFIDKFARPWGPLLPENPDNPVPPTAAELEPFRRRFSADVYDWASLSSAFAQSTDPQVFQFWSLMLRRIASSFGGNPWFIFYHFFYPAHEENLRWCEFVALLNNLGKEIPLPLSHRPPGIPADFDSSGPFGETWGLHRADYAGDWSSVCVIVPGNPEWLPSPSAPQQLLPEDDADLPRPKLVGFGQRIRSMVAEGGRYTFDQMMRVTDEFQTVGDRHVKLFAARGTHNNFNAAGRHTSPRSESVLDSACDVNGTTEHSRPPWDKSLDKKEKRRLAWLILLKALGGGPIGLLIALQEIFGYKGLPDRPGGFEPDAPTEEAPESETQAMIIAPEDVLGSLGLGSAWQISDDDLVDGQIWWPPPLGPENGYRGAWGVTCAEDPFDARSGMLFPDTRPTLIESLAIFLEKEG